VRGWGSGPLNPALQHITYSIFPIQLNYLQNFRSCDVNPKLPIYIYIYIADIRVGLPAAD